MELFIFQRLIRLHKEFLHLYYQHMHKRSKLMSFFIGVASLYLIKTLAKLLWMVVPRVRSNIISKYGRNSWAVVTGGSDGIGKEFCIELAKQGFNIVIVARNEQKMNELCASLQNSHVETKTIVADFSQGHSVEFYEKVKSELRYLDISILVNNVGMSEGSLFAKEKMENILKTLRVNALSTLMMTRILINKLEFRQNKSAVITVSSGLAYLPCPYLSVYSCTKSFTHYFTQSLGLTYKNTDFLSVTPLGVRTKMFAMKQGFKVIEPNQLVKNVLEDLRVGKQISYGWNVHMEIKTIEIKLKQELEPICEIYISNTNDFYTYTNCQEFIHFQTQPQQISILIFASIVILLISLSILVLISRESKNDMQHNI